ncbi:MAG: T9SS type B sorting domain-containing protein [Aequorivita sp.]
MKNFYSLYFILYTSIMLFTGLSYGQAPGNPFVDAGEDQVVDCSVGCTDITADFLDIGDTSTYRVGQILYNPPFPFNGLANSMNPDFDDRWTGVEELPFDLCFFGVIRNEFQVGSNGVLRFDVDPNNTYNAWGFDGDLPNNVEAALSEANVFTPAHDLDPTKSSSEEIGYEVIGTAPNRVLVLSYYNVPLYSCNSELATQMVVFYETTNVIDIYIKDKPTCSWNGGNAALGIQNDAGTTAIVPPGRNTSDSPWTANNEAWRFYPDGPSVVTFEWLDETGTVIGTTPTINVCPSGTEIYTARATYTSCNGDVVVVEDEVEISLIADFEVDLGPDISTCSDDPIVLDADTGVPTVSYEWFYNGVVIPGETNATYTVNAPDSGTYTAVATDNDCSVSDDIEITFLSQPIIASPPEDLFICDDGTGSGIFDLTENNNVVRGTQDPAFPISYHHDQLAAENGTAPIIPDDAYQIVGNSEVIWVRIEDSTETCYAIDSFEISFESVTATQPDTPYYMCDQDDNGEESINLAAVFSDIIRDGQSPLLYTVTYHANLGDANTGDNPLPQPYIVNTSPVTIYARVENNNNTDCFETTEFEIILDTPPTVNETPDPLVACDSDSDGFTDFFLHNADDDITGGDPDLTVTYHYTLLDAQTNEGILLEPFENVIPYNDEVWARVEGPNTSCYATVKLELEVRDSPVLTEPTPYRLCDDNNDGYEIFDLTSKAEEILGNLDPLEYELYYYRDELDAIAAGEAALDNPDFSQAIGNTTAYQNEIQNTQTLYVLGVGTQASVTPNNGAEGCFDIVELELIVDPMPEGVEPEDYHLCDDTINGSTPTDQVSTFDLTSRNGEVTGGDAGLQVFWFETIADEEADTPIPDPTAYQNTANAQTIVARITNGFECKDLVTLTLVVDPLPTPVAPTTLYACDADNNGIAYFDIASKTQEIQGGNPNLVVTYHETMVDAETGNYPLASPYENIILFNQTLFVRVAFDNPPAGSGDCYAIVELELEVVPTPVVPQDLPDLTVCDDTGFYEFDLTQQEDLIYGDQSHEDYTLTYHLTENDAIEGENAITQPEAYTNVTNPQTIWVRLAHNETECYKVGSFDLVVNSGLPIIDPEPFVKCDDLGEPFDGITTFDLTEKNAEITDGVLTQGVLYFENEADAENNENPIDPDTAYENVENPQLLYVRVTDSNTECISFTTLTLKVVSNPEPVTPDPIVLCDVNLIIPPGPYDEVELFDLTSREAQIQNGNNWDIAYFESYDDAVNQEDAIPAAETTAYQNTSNPQIIYVRVTNPDSECFEIVELELIVNPLPDDSAEISDYIICSADDSEIGIFNLETKVPEILGDQTDPPFAVSFYLDPTDAENQTNAIQNTTTHQNKDANNNAINPQTIYVGITDSETGCYIGGAQSFDLIVQRGAIAVAPAEPFVICDNLPPIDGYAEFNLDDLTDQQVADLHAEILAGQDPEVYGITFHESLEGAETGTNAISFPYVNIINPQRIYVRVTNNDNQYEPKCYAVVEMIIKVEQLPEIILDDEYRLCVDENGNPIPEEEGSVSPPVIDTGLDPALFTFVWEHDGVIIVGETGPSIIVLEAGEYTVTYTEIASGCENSVSTTVFISSPPFTYDANVVSDAFAGSHIIEVTSDGEGTYHYQLDNGPFQESGTFENVSPGTHLITIKDIYGCGSVTIEVGVIDYPPYFTPNEDGYHDTWNIIGIAVGDPTAKIYIFDRHGKLLKQLSPMGPGWDGTYNGNPMPSSDYWFRVEYTEDGNAKEFKGHFTLKR